MYVMFIIAKVKKIKLGKEIEVRGARKTSMRS